MFFCVPSCLSEPQKRLPIKRPRVVIPEIRRCNKNPVIIAVIDTGFGIGWDGEEKVRLCKFGHKDFTETGAYHNRYEFHTQDSVPMDFHGHGTHVAGIIDDLLKTSKVDYCIVVIKYYEREGSHNIENTVKAINYARMIHVKYINYSGGGTMMDNQEKDAVKKYIDQGGVMLAAAGNDHKDLKINHYYPAMEDDRVIVVGSLNGRDGQRSTFSNFGDRVNRWEIGENVSVYGRYMSGTSQATAIATGKKVLEDSCK